MLSFASPRFFSCQGLLTINNVTGGKDNEVRVHVGRYEVPEYDPEKHNPERVFAMLCYRGIHYAKWVVLDPFKIKTWK